jgi:hypothetical protein
MPTPASDQAPSNAHRPRLAHPLCGANLTTLVSALTAGGGVASGRRPQAAIALAACLARLPFTALERLYVAGRLRRAPPLAPPIFIVGHWRSGTTHLTNLMSQAGFGYVPPLAAGLPWDLLGLARLFRPLLERALPGERFIDRIPVTPTSPQEDEIALANMTTLSYYHGLYFPRRFAAAFERGLFFDGCAAEEIVAWQRCQRSFLAKLALAQPGRRLLIKNPAYTARLAMLHEMYPGAKFIHIHRNPHEIFDSMRNFYDKLLRELALQTYAHIDIDRHILATFARMMDRHLAEAPELPEGSYVELAYEDLVADPMAALSEIYERLGLEGFEEARPRFAAYLNSVCDYRTNRYDTSAQSAALVEAHWSRFLDHWGYARPAAVQ